MSGSLVDLSRAGMTAATFTSPPRAQKLMTSISGSSLTYSWSGLRIAVFLALEVAQHHFLLVEADDVFGHERNLAAAARERR